MTEPAEIYKGTGAVKFYCIFIAVDKHEVNNKKYGSDSTNT